MSGFEHKFLKFQNYALSTVPQSQMILLEEIYKALVTKGLWNLRDISSLLPIQGSDIGK